MFPKNELDGIFDELIDNINSTFDQFYAAYTFQNLGQIQISQIDEETEITLPSIGNDILVESLLMSEVKGFTNTYPYFLIETFHSKLVQKWQDCLSDIFVLFINLHITNKRCFKELKDVNVQLHFDKQEPLLEQICNKCIDNFDFWKYSDKISIINKIFPSDLDSDLLNIKKNIEIRNMIQHNHGTVKEKNTKNLGMGNKIEVLDINGKKKCYEVGQTIKLTLPELYSFKKSIIKVIQTWRSSHEQD